MSADKKAGTKIIKPLAAAFLTSLPEDDKLEEFREAKPAPVREKPVAPRPVEPPLSLSREETRALLKEQLVESTKHSEKRKAAPAPAEEKEEVEEAKEEPVKEEAAPKPATEEELIVEYGSESYSREDLINRALKIWTREMKRGRSELHSMELYVKPGEKRVYYVFNKKRNGSFEL
ncbi:MAG: hypothetical protein IK115_11115 [Lachnospiraceae bacterium]|nr:hypothetical protein [Lachnospiraceae bacterium]